jgi:hypothetical protein
MATFTSETTLAQTVDTGALQPGTRAVQLVLWPSSPKAQQRSPLSTFQNAAIAAHSEGVLLVAAPKLGLMATLAPKTAKQNWDVAFLRRRVAVSAARSADAVVLPFTDVQAYTSAYSFFAEVAAQQLKTVKRSVEVLAGVSAGNSPAPQMQAKVATEVRNTSDLVSGYNLTGGSSSALSLLQWMYTQG